MVIRVILSLVSYSCTDHIYYHAKRIRANALYAYTYTTEGDQVDAHNDFTGWAAVSLSPGTYAADFYGRSTPIYTFHVRVYPRAIHERIVDDAIV